MWALVGKRFGFWGIKSKFTFKLFSKIMNKRQLLILHISFWILITFSGAILNFIGESQYQFNWIDFFRPYSLSSLFFKIFISYLILYIFDRFLNQKKYVKLIIGFLIVCCIYSILRYLVEEVLFFYWFGTHNYSADGRRFPYYLTDGMQNVISFSFYAFFLKMIQDFFRNEKEKRELLIEKHTAEQAFLKNQLNPHFLFNTLNNIYSLTLNQSPNAPEAVLKLSELMRYMLYESNVDKINLETEVKYLRNFIELQKMRYSKQVFVDFEVAGDLHTQQVAPLLLISFVENSFKHGDVNDSTNPLVIKLLVSQNNLNFTVSNHKKDQNKDEVGGVGLENVRRRLALIYPNQHSLEVQDSDKHYHCELNIIL
jgi:two-component system, LytTR family, sensor kinase